MSQLIIRLVQHARCILESNVDLVKKFYELFKKGDRQYLQMCDENSEWVTMHGMPNGGTYVGKKQVFEGYFPKLLANFSEFHADTESSLE